MTGSCSAGIMTARSVGVKVIGCSRLLDLLRILLREKGFAKSEERLGSAWIEWQVNGLLSRKWLSEPTLVSTARVCSSKKQETKRVRLGGCKGAMSINRQVTNSGDPSLLSAMIDCTEVVGGSRHQCLFIFFRSRSNVGVQRSPIAREDQHRA